MTTETARFTDNGDGTVTDSGTGLTWTKEDCWQREKQWVSWDEAEKYVENLCYVSLADTQDWRLPTKSELSDLYEADKTNKDKYGKEIHLDPIFAEGSQAKNWTSEYTGNDAYIVDFSTGEVRLLYKSKAGRMSARGVRTSGPKTSEKDGGGSFDADKFRTAR